VSGTPHTHTDGTARRQAPASVHVWLIAACLGAFLLQQWLPGRLLEDFALYGPAVVQGEVHRLVTAGFLHLGLAHLAMNMLALFFLGRVLEPALAQGGRFRFILLYVISLVSGSLGAMVLDFESAAVGASGAVYGLLGAAVSIPLRMGLGWNRLGVGPWIAFNLAVTFAVPGISIGGHVGGLVSGFVLGWVLAPRR
jgi:membrane associated rhomboid family serine protease